VCKERWKIEEFHRELKQLTGVESCQCRHAQIQRNHIACAILVWSSLKKTAYFIGKTVYQLKHELLSEYLKKELRYPTLTRSTYLTAKPIILEQLDFSLTMAIALLNLLSDRSFLARYI
jgi:hypothetical protein